jgi:hypothetical protein
MLCLKLRGWYFVPIYVIGVLCWINDVRFVIYVVEGGRSIVRIQTAVFKHGPSRSVGYQAVSGHIFVMPHEGKSYSCARAYDGFGLVLCLRYDIYGNQAKCRPITVAAQSKAWTVFARSNAGIVGSNLTQGLDIYVRLPCVCVVLCVGSGLASGWSPVQGVLLTVCRLRNWKVAKVQQRGIEP